MKRRDFLKHSAAGAGIAAGSGLLAGCASESDSALEAGLAAANSRVEQLEAALAKRHGGAPATGGIGDWRASLRAWAESELRKNDQPILDQALPDFEKIMINAALAHTNGRRRDAAVALGWGRNTLTRKIKELGMGD